jgi:hypothetical protein
MRPPLAPDFIREMGAAAYVNDDPESAYGNASRADTATTWSELALTAMEKAFCRAMMRAHPEREVPL